ncbi:MAG TPA: pantoate--beta-alanine ligase [Desulfobulbus sp.]|nr:pantoate--beta-alanine ligase [Desulfobulbus sp.]
MRIITSPAEMRAWAGEQHTHDHSLALVPTMGFFHKGHLALMQMAAGKADKVVVSLFVNPIQFGPGEDLDQYPVDLQKDEELARSQGVSVLFMPTSEDMYPAGFQTLVSVPELSRHLCGADRPGHFNGVTTVVCKLLHIVRPDFAVFGEKDFQQLAVIRRMVADLNMDTAILAHPIVREPDGLAMSSRNSYLGDDERKQALCLSRSIAHARRLYAGGMHDTMRLEAEVRNIIEKVPGAHVRYIGFVDRTTLEPVNQADENTQLALAITIGGRVRLIDNGRLAEAG